MTGPAGLPAPAAVRVDGWGWRYAGRRDWAVRDLTFTVDPGERVLLLGSSGSGKSTVLAGLAGVLGGDDEGEQEGTLGIDGARPDHARGRTGLLLQDPDAQIVLARVGDDVAFACENLAVPREQIWSRVRESLGSVGLGLPLDHPTAQLSGGQKQRLALAGILAMRPGLVLLDEPTANLDPDGVTEVRDAVAAAVARTGATLIVVEHRVSIWRELVDRVIVLAPDGGVLADGSPDAVLADESAELRRAGIWLPDEAVPIASPVTSGDALLTAEALRFAPGRGVSRRGGSRPVTVPPLPPQVDLRIREGSATALTGRNGSGKSTLALTLGGLLPAAGGTLRAESALRASRFAGTARPVGPEPALWRSRQLVSRIGSVFQNPEHQFVATTVRDELSAGPRAVGETDERIRSRVDELLERLALDRLAEANPFTLSGGQKRRLSVATALATRPRVLLLDEPTFGQDASTWAQLVEIIGRLRADGHAIVAATHDAAFVAAVGAHELLLQPGSVAGVTRSVR